MSKKDSQKKLRKIVVTDSEELYEGFTLSKTGELAINIELLYDCSDNEEDFIAKFSRTLLHEQLHWIIQDILGDNKRTQVGEELVVRLLVGQQFTTKERRKYEEW